VAAKPRAIVDLQILAVEQKPDLSQHEPVGFHLRELADKDSRFDGRERDLNICVGWRTT
jgi:hypothetical protein